MARYVKPVLNLNADDVWAAACAAQRTNGAYINAYQLVENGQRPNREIMTQAIENTSLITDADREEGKVVRQHFKGLTFKILQGIKINDFENTAMLIANRDVITDSYDLAVIASLPGCYARDKKRNEINNRVRFASGGFIGRVGDKVTRNDVEVLRCLYSQQWNTYFVTCLTADDEAIFFSYKKEVAAGTKLNIQGTVKAHREDSTQLNRVKVI